MADSVHNNGAASGPGSQAITRADLHDFRVAIFADLPALIATQVQSVIEAVLKPAIDAALGPISSALDGLRVAVEAQGRRISDLERGLSDYSDRVVTLELAVTRLNSDCMQMADKIDDLESRSRRCNLRVVGIPERVEGADPVAFMSVFFTEVLGNSLAPSPMKLDRAHRLGPPPTGNAVNARPRVMIVKFHNFRDKEAIIRRPAKEQLLFRGKKVHIFPDFTSAVAKKRAAFLDVKRILYEKKVRFSLRFPAKLHVDHNGENLRFDSPEEAKAWLGRNV